MEEDTDKTETEVTHESEDELSDEDLSEATGGASFSYGSIQVTYTPQSNP